MEDGWIRRRIGMIRVLEVIHIGILRVRREHLWTIIKMLLIQWSCLYKACIKEAIIYILKPIQIIQIQIPPKPTVKAIWTANHLNNHLSFNTKIPMEETISKNLKTKTGLIVKLCKKLRISMTINKFKRKSHLILSSFQDSNQ